MISWDLKNTEHGVEEMALPLSAAEIRQLRHLLAVARFDELQRAFVIDTGKAKIVVREDGTIRCEGESVTFMSDRSITLNGAAIELN